MRSLKFPKPKPELANEYKLQCNKSNLKYVWYFSLLAAFVFGFHLLHHFRLGMLAFSAEMIPYTLMYSFGVIYPGLNVILLSKVKDVPALTPIASFIELAFPFFIGAIAVLLATLGVQHGQGITPYAILIMLICFLIHGQFPLLLGVVIGTWLSLAALLIMTVDATLYSPSLAIGFTCGVAAIAIAFITERLRVRQFQIITDLNTSNRQLQLLSSQDPLTGLLNRRSFDQVLEREMARSERFGNPLSLLLIDIDDFKHVNDTFGHVYGDDVLKQTALAIKSQVRDVDFVGRLGGDEFVVLLIETDKHFSLQIAERMRAEASKLLSDKKNSLLSISIGHAQYAGESLSAFVQRADDALYKAKKAGKNKVRSLSAPFSTATGL